MKNFLSSLLAWFLIGVIGAVILGVVAFLWWLDHIRFVY